MSQSVLPLFDTEKLYIAYRYSKTIKILSLIDIIFNCLYLFVNYIYLIPLLLAWTGYYGAKKFKSSYTLVYLIYNVICTIGRISFSAYQFYYIYHNNLEEYYQTANFELFFSIFYFLFSIYIIRIIIQFYKLLTSFTQEELNKLRYCQFNVTYIFW